MWCTFPDLCTLPAIGSCFSRRSPGHTCMVHEKACMSVVETVACMPRGSGFACAATAVCTQFIAAIYHVSQFVQSSCFRGVAISHVCQFAGLRFANISNADANSTENSEWRPGKQSAGFLFCHLYNLKLQSNFVFRFCVSLSCIQETSSATHCSFNLSTINCNSGSRKQYNNSQQNYQ